MIFNAVIFLPCFQVSNAQRRVSTFDFFFFCEEFFLLGDRELEKWLQSRQNPGPIGPDSSLCIHPPGRQSQEGESFG